MMIIKE